MNDLPTIRIIQGMENKIVIILLTKYIFGILTSFKHPYKPAWQVRKLRLA